MNFSEESPFFWEAANQFTFEVNKKNKLSVN